MLSMLAVAAIGIKYMMIKKIRMTDFLCIFFIVTLGVIYTAYYRNIGILNLAIAILIAKEMDFNKLFKYNLISMLFSFLAICATSFFGITTVSREMYKIDGLRMLYSFGFASSNTVFLFLFSMVTSFNLMRGNRLKFREIFMEFLVSVGFYLLCLDRTAMLVMVCYLAGLVICRKASRSVVLRLLIRPWQYAYVLFAGITFYAVTHFDTSLLMGELNILLSDRLHLLSTILYYSGIHLLGNADVIDQLSISVDNAYIFNLAAYGWLMIVLYGLIFIYTSKRGYRDKNWAVLVTVIAYSAYGLGENQVFFSLICNVFLLFGYMTLNQQEVKELSHVS